MGRKFIFLIFAIFLISVVSAEMKLTTPLKKTYNLGESINLPIKIIANSDMASIFSAELLCNGKVISLPIQYPIVLSGGEEQIMNPPIPLMKEIIGNLTGICKIKVFLGEEYLLTKDFKISKLLSISLTEKKTEFSPGESITLEGEATKESGNLVNGFATLIVMNEDLSSVIELSDSVQGGYFLINSSLPEDTKAGQHPVRLVVYERDMLGEITNQGDVNYNIEIKQVPTSLEVAYETKEIEPGTSLKVKAILHDQTGEKIDSTAYIIVENGNKKIIEENETLTDEFLEIPIAYNEPPSEWKVNITSNGITSEENFIIKEKEEVKTELINDTIFLTNIGNVPYNNILLVKINNESLNINISLDVDENHAYSLTAPDGKYQIEIVTDGKSQIVSGVMLTGKQIDLREASSEVITLMAHPVVWIFIIVVFAGAAFVIFKKRHKKSFFEYFKAKKNKNTPFESSAKNDSMTPKKNKAELSLSIKGDKQNVSLVCLKLKNAKEINSQKGNAKATIQKVIDFAEINKAYTYENQDNLFFIFSPFRTKTFKNEKSAIEVSNRIKEFLVHHNRLYKQKIEFGISINYGAIIAKQENSGLKFMSMGLLITNAKKISGLADREVLLSKEINEKLSRDIKTEKQLKGDGISVYSIKEIRDLAEGRRYVDNLIKRL